MDKIEVLCKAIPTTAADTEDEWYLAQPFPGLWRVEFAYWVPDTAVAANGTNYRTWTVKRNTIAAPTTWTDIGTLSTATTGDVIGTSRPVTLSGNRELAQGEQLQFEKRDPGTGALAHGSWIVGLRKVN